MAEIDPRIREFEREAAKTEAAMKRSRARAEAFERETKRGQATRAELDQRVRTEVARDRIKGETVGETAPRSRKALDEQAGATRKAATEEERLQRLQKQSVASEARLTKQREASTRSLITQEEAVRRYGRAAGQRYYEKQVLQRYGPYAGQKYLQGQGPGATVLTREEARDAAIRQRGYLGGVGFDRRYPPPPPPPPPGAPPGGVGGGGGEPPFRRQAVGDVQKESAALAQMRRELQGATLAQQRLMQVQASGSNVLRRHGALTTEFIQAAARGEVTIRELGYQTAATIGKFGGWITAGAALYGALGAVDKLSQGALAASSGINQVKRVINEVDPKPLEEGFSNLADYFQLPTAEVTEGVYEMGKVFHTQNEALAASKALLYSVKVGELDTATAGRYLIGITNAYNLSQKDLNSTFDKFNQLQNNFGVAISGTEAATARAAGSFANAGGSLDYLIALIGTASRVTGAAPERVGTAIQRSASFIHKPANEQVLRDFGINPRQSIENIYEEAFKAAQSQSGRRRRQLAAAIFGPQYGASIGTPLLRQFDIFKRMRESIARSEGSGARELSKLKESPEEQLKNIGVQLERLGNNLAQSGLLNIFAGIVLGLDDALRLTNSLVEAFNSMPGPLKEAAAILLQVGLLTRGLSRLNVGESIAPSGQKVGAGRSFLGAALGGGARRDARLIRKGLYAEQAALEEEFARSVSGGARAATRAADAKAIAVQKQQQLSVLAGKEASSAEELKAQRERMGTLQAEITTLNEESASAVQNRVRSELDQREQAKRLNETNQQIARTKGRFGVGLNVPGTVADAERRGSGAYPTSFQVPTTQEPLVMATETGPLSGKQQAERARAIAETERAQLVAGEQALAQGERQARVTSGRLTRFRTAAGKFGNAFNAMVGHLGSIFFGGFIIATIFDLLGEQITNVENEFAAIDKAAANQRQAAAHLKELKEHHSTSFSDIVNDVVSTAGGVFQATPIGGLLSGEGIASITRLYPGAFVAKAAQNVRELRQGGSTSELINAEKELQAAIAEERLGRQREARHEGKPIPERYAADIQRDIEHVRKGHLPAKAARKLLTKYEEELALSMEAQHAAAGSVKDQEARLKKAEQAIRQQKVATAGGRKGLLAALQGLEPKEVEEVLEAEISRAGQVGGLTPHRIQRIRTVYENQRRRLGSSTNPEDVQTMESARNAYFDALQKSITAELELTLKLARTPEQRHAAYRRALQQQRQAYLQGSRRELTNARQRVEKLEQELAEPVDSKTVSVGGLWGHISFRTKGSDRSKIRTRLQAAKKALKDLNADQREKEKLFRLYAKELQEQRYEEEAALREARTNLQVSRTADPLAQARIKLRAVNTEIGRAIDVYGRSSKEVLELLAQRQEIIAQRVQDQVNSIEASGALRAARLSGRGQETEKARVELQTLEQKLSFERGHANRFNPADITQLQAEVIEARIALQQEIADEAKELAEAGFDIRVARAEAGGNEVRAARINLAKARYELHHAETPLEKRQARANVIGQRAALRDASLRAQIEDIEFQADIGKLTLDEQIHAYQRLLNTQKLTRDARRDLRRKIYSLKHETENEGSFDLAVGDIRLPTLYEIRRAAGQGINGRGINVHQTNHYTVNGARDPQAVAAEITRLNGGANKAALRSAGVR